MQRKTEETLAGLVSGRPVRAHDFMQEISLEIIIAAIFGTTEPARAKRLRTATNALMREASSRRFLLQTIIATARRDGWDGPFPRIRRAVAAINAVVLEEVNERKRAGDLGGTTCSGCSCAPPASTAARCLTTSSATRCGRC